MAKTPGYNRATPTDDFTNPRRSARRSTLEIDEVVNEQIIKNEHGVSENVSTSERKPSKAKAKRAFTDSPHAAELRRSKRIKSREPLKQNGHSKQDQTGKRGLKENMGLGKREHDRSPALLIEAKDEHDDEARTPAHKPSPSKSRTENLQAKKLKSYSQFAAAQQSPYPGFARPRPEECKLAHKILASLHGERRRPEDLGLATTAPSSRAGCGDSASVLDALVRTILSQNTSDTNSTRAKLAMDRVYGGSDAWAAIVEGGQAKLARTIESGGLAVVKSRVILGILEATHGKYGAYSLDHLFERSDDEAMREMLAFKGVGPKTASCVLLFCLRRPSFAVDTHVHRITGLLGWRPPEATRDQTHAHLDARIPDEDKYGLHVLLVRHGKDCEECRAGGKSLGRCALRKAFKKGRMAGEAGEEAEKEEERQIKAEEDTDDDVKG